MTAVSKCQKRNIQHHERKTHLDRRPPPRRRESHWFVRLSCPGTASLSSKARGPLLPSSQPGGQAPTCGFRVSMCVTLRRGAAQGLGEAGWPNLEVAQ